MKKYYFTLVTFLFLAVANAQIVNIPDANFKAKLLAANTTTNLFASTQAQLNSNWGGGSAWVKIDTNNDGQIQISEASLIKYLYIDSSNITNLEGINAFTNLEFFSCGSNQLINLNVNSLTNLKFLSCGYNQIQSLDVSNSTNLTELYCRTNQLTSLNVTGLANLKELVCSENQLTILNVLSSTSLRTLSYANNNIPNINISGLNIIVNLDCGGNQITSLDLSSLPILQFFYCDNNLLTNLDLSSKPYLKYFYCNNNLLTSLDLDNLTNLEDLRCSDNQLSTLAIIDSPLLVKLTCLNNQLNSLFIKNNNTSWSNLNFNNNPNLAYVCANEDDLSFVQSKINSYGYTSTCHVNSYCSFNPGGAFYAIQGNTKNDFNGDGCDVNDSIYPNLKFNITNGSISNTLISNTSGNYYIPVSFGSYTITPQFENTNYFIISPANATVSFPANPTPSVNDFCIAPNGIHHDLEVVIIPLESAIPGFETFYKIKYKNKGNLTENATLNFNYNDNKMDLGEVSVLPTSQSTGTLFWSIGTLLPFQSGEILLAFGINTPFDTPPVNAGNVLTYTATINGLNSDETPNDNTFTLNQTVVNSFDPNDKTCLEGVIINPSNIGKYVHYKIRFENTGTFAAQNIVVKDMIDTTKFDITSLQMTDASHSCVTRITNPNKVEFIFENINLPFDDANNDGYVVFKIKTKPTLVVGNTISNSANIYFDYNFPIVTNTATSTFSVLQNDTFEFDNYFTIYPNPVNEVLNLKTKQDTEVYSLTIYNLLGQQVQTTTNPTNTVDVSSLKTGNYIVKVFTDKGVSSSKFVKE